MEELNAIMDETVFLQGPTFETELSFLDAYIFNLYSFRILCFCLSETSSHASMIMTLKQALQRLVIKAPILGGIIESSVDDADAKRQRGWKNAKPGPVIELIIKDLTLSMDFAELESRNFPISELKCNEMIPVSPHDTFKTTAAASKFQLSCVKGGAFLSVCIDHPVSDGNGMNEMMRALAAECYAVQTNSEEALAMSPLMGMDRSLAIALSKFPSSKNRQEDHPSYVFLPDPALKQPQPEGPEEKARSPELKCYMFAISPSNLVELKKAATGTMPVSTHDAIAALTWRTVMYSRHKAGTVPDPSTICIFSMPTNTRRHVDIPAEYVGNMVYKMSCSMPLSDLLLPSSLPTAAALIRKDLSSIDKDRILGFWSLAATLPHVRMLCDVTLLGYATTCVGLGTSWKADSMYGADWGPVFGKVRRFRCPDTGFLADFQGLPFVLPRVGGTGPAEVLMWLEPEGREALRDDGLFSRFFVEI